LLVESGDNLRQGMGPGQRGPQAPPLRMRGINWRQAPSQQVKPNQKPVLAPTTRSAPPQATARSVSPPPNAARTASITAGCRDTLVRSSPPPPFRWCWRSGHHPAYSVTGSRAGALTKRLKRCSKHGVTRFNGSRYSYYKRLTHRFADSTSADQALLRPMPSTHEGEVIRGKPARFARITETRVELPQQTKSASFFTVQGQASAQAAE